VVLAAGGYPDSPRKGDPIAGLAAGAAVGTDGLVFHAGTALEGDRVTTQGGRVLCVTALGDSVKIAQSRAYDIVQGIHFEGMQYRRDIGHQALSRRTPALNPLQRKT
jgi:phosphoribosylamine--glycine ligase